MHRQFLYLLCLLGLLGTEAFARGKYLSRQDFSFIYETLKEASDNGMMREDLFRADFKLIFDRCEAIHQLYETGEEVEASPEFRDNYFMLGTFFFQKEQRIKYYHDSVKSLKFKLRNSYENLVRILKRYRFNLFQRLPGQAGWQKIKMTGGLTSIEGFPFFSDSKKKVRYSGTSRTKTFLTPLADTLDQLEVPIALGIDDEVEEMQEIANSIFGKEEEEVEQPDTAEQSQEAEQSEETEAQASEQSEHGIFSLKLNQKAIRIIDLYSRIRPRLEEYERDLRRDTSMDEVERRATLLKLQELRDIMIPLQELKDHGPGHNRALGGRPD